MQRFTAREPYQIGFRVIREGETRHVVAYVAHWGPLPASIPFILGDICNNFQSALEHLLWQFWLDIDPTFNGNVIFPVQKTRELFEANSPSNIGRLPDRQRTLIERAQPYNKGNDLLLILQDINRIDKHSLLSVATATARMEQVRLIGYQTVPGYNLTTFTIHPGTPIERGAELAHISIENLEATGNGHSAANLGFNFLFTQPDVVAGLGVATTMREIRDEVQWVLDQFENPE